MWVILRVPVPEFEPRRLWQHIILELFARLDDVHVALTVKPLHQGVQLFISGVHHAFSLTLEERGLDADFCLLAIDIGQREADFSAAQ